MAAHLLVPSTVAPGNTPQARHEAFEACWWYWPAGAPPPRWEDYLPPDGQACTPDFAFLLIQTDIEARVRSGMAALLAEPYFQHPRLQAADARLSEAQQVNLVRWEYQQRWNRGDRVTRQAYVERFSEHAVALRNLKPRWNCPHCKHTAIPLEDEAATEATCPWCQKTHSLSSLFPSSPARPGVSTAPPQGGSTPHVPSIHPLVPGYEVLEELGRGGMGVVYKARQVKLRRVVALKMILSGGHASTAELARFQTEAEAIARLQHPNIVQVHEVGEHDGRPFFSLEFCPDGSLDRKLDGTPWQPMEAARLVETLSRAMHAAHEKNVVHRDLKPGNVLLTADGTPKITDFGLAKKLEGEPGALAPGVTQTGAILGTPSYMAPEQTGGRGKEIGPACDVYALGAILYELLTGRPPFRAATPLDTVLQVVNDEPVPLRRLQSRTPIDLETICHKCLHKEPGRRYATALELAEDLKRFQAGMPVLARPVGSVERSWRWCRRYPGVAALTATVVLFLVATPVISLRYAVHLEAARTAAEREAEKARGALRLAMASLDAAVNKITENKRLQDRGFFEMRKELLSAVLPHYEQLAALQGDDPDLEAERARAFGKLGTIHWWMEDNKQAVRDYREMAAVFERLLAGYPDRPAYLYAAAISHNDLGSLFCERGANTEAKEGYDRGEEMAQRLVALVPDEADYHDIRLKLRVNRAIWLTRLGKYEEALLRLGGARQFQAEAQAAFPDNAVWPVYLGRIHDTCGFCYGKMGRRADAEKAYRAALAVLRPIGEARSASHENQDALGKAWVHLGTQLTRPEESLAAFQQSRDVYKRLSAELPGVPSYREKLCGADHNLARTYDKLGKPVLAAQLRRQSMEGFEKLAAEFPLLSQFTEALALSYTGAGLDEQKLWKYEAALEWFSKAASIRERLYQQEPGNQELKQNLADVHRKAAECLVQLGRYAEAVLDFDRALALDAGKNRLALQAGRFAAVHGIRQESAAALQLARAGQHEKAVLAAEALIRGRNAHPEMDFNAACIFSICAGKIKDKDTRVADTYEARAVALLAKIKASGWFKEGTLGQMLRTDNDLKPLRDRADFKQLLADRSGNSP